VEERQKVAARLSFISERDGNREVYLIRPDGQEERRLTSDPIADYNGPASPDGTALVLMSAQGEGGPQRFFVYPLGGGKPRKLGPDLGRLRYPSWSPDGRWLVFESNLQSHFSDLYRIGRDGAGLRRLTDNPEGNFEPALSPRGDAIVFVSSRDRVAELYRMRADGTGSQRLTNTPRDEWGARWSPDGELLVFVSDRESAERVYVMPASGGEAKRVSQRDLDVQVVETSPTWAPVGRRLAYVLREPPQPSRLVIVDVTPSGPRVVGELSDPGGGALGEPAWSPEGRYLALTVTQGKDTQIAIARADGTGLVKVTKAQGPNWNPQWVPPEMPRKVGGAGERR
jgi:Tol biopolymer transport system component